MFVSIIDILREFIVNEQFYSVWKAMNVSGFGMIDKVRVDVGVSKEDMNSFVNALEMAKLIKRVNKIAYSVEGDGLKLGKSIKLLVE